MKNICLFGGSFDPPTNGHIQTAQFVLNTSNEFDEVWITPCYKHMYNKEMVSPDHRLEMCRLASKVDGRIKVFDYEIKNKLSGKTYNLVKRLKTETELTEKYKFSMIIGIDNANTFNHWVNFEELERLIGFVVVPRKGYVRDEKVDWYLKYPHIYLNNDNNIIEISSTDIRNLLSSFYTENKLKYEDILKYMNKDVLDYILQHELYLKK